MSVFREKRSKFDIFDYLSSKLIPKTDMGRQGDPRVKAALNLDDIFAKIHQDCPANCEALGCSWVKTSLRIDGICCSSEVPPIEATVKSLPSVEAVSVDVKTKTVSVVHDFKVTDSENILKALKDEGFNTTRMDSLGDVPCDDPKGTSGTSAIYVADICCASEIPPIKAILEPLPSVEKVSVNTIGRTVLVQHDFRVTSVTLMIKALRKDGFDATLLSDAGAELMGNGKPAPQVTPESNGVVSVNVVLCGILWFASMFCYIDTPKNDLQYLAVASFALGIYQIACKAYKSAKKFIIDTNTLMFVASVGAMGLRDYTEAAGLTFLFSLGNWLEVRATGKARRALKAIVSLKPDTANKQLENKTGGVSYVNVPAEAVKVGEFVMVKPGDKVPVDGEVVKGETVLNESSLTGESMPVKKKPGDGVFSGTINIGLAPVVLKCTATTSNSTVTKLIKLVEEAAANRSPTEKMVDEFAKYYTPLVILASMCMCTFPWLVSKEVGYIWLERGIILIVIACPCALIISTPVAYMAGCTAIAQKGIVVKGGIHLETLAYVRTVCSDKTGTLTHGEFSMSHFELVTPNTPARRGKKVKIQRVGADEILSRLALRDERSALKYLAVLEAESSHPMASALVASAKARGIILEAKDSCSEHSILKGEG